MGLSADWQVRYCAGWDAATGRRSPRPLATGCFVADLLVLDEGTVLD